MHLVTAEQYENLGKLYQTTIYERGWMEELYKRYPMYERSEEMYLKAIKIKEALLGKEDYEVGLSLGHLADLYANHMSKLEPAEELFLRSNKLITHLFGLSHSGLRSNFYGLSRVR